MTQPGDSSPDLRRPRRSEEPYTSRIEPPRLQQAVTRSYQMYLSQMRLLPVQRERLWQSAAPGARGVRTFVVLPHSRRNDAPHWMVELTVGEGNKPIGIEIADDLVIGMRRNGGSRPDLDIGLYSTGESGVSRQHALLQPGYVSLYITDLGSTNGTWLNNTRLEPYILVEVPDHAVINLGALTLTLRVVATPADLGMRDDHTEPG